MGGTHISTTRQRTDSPRAPLHPSVVSQRASAEPELRPLPLCFCISCLLLLRGPLCSPEPLLPAASVAAAMSDRDDDDEVAGEQTVIAFDPALRTLHASIQFYAQHQLYTQLKGVGFQQACSARELLAQPLHSLSALPLCIALRCVASCDRCASAR